MKRPFCRGGALLSSERVQKLRLVLMPVKAKRLFLDLQYFDPHIRNQPNNFASMKAPRQVPDELF